MQPAALAELAREIHARGLDIITYTGFTYEQLLNGNDPARMALLRETDYLIDGPFEIGKRSLDLQFRGSSNQRIIDVRASLESGKVVEKVF